MLHLCFNVLRSTCTYIYIVYLHRYGVRSAPSGFRALQQPAFRHIFCAETHLDQLPMDENRVLLTGENPFIRLNAEGPDGEATTNASFWRILYWCAAARNRLPVRPLPLKQIAAD
jgi:hypothetical protein